MHQSCFWKSRLFSAPFLYWQRTKFTGDCLLSPVSSALRLQSTDTCCTKALGLQSVLAKNTQFGATVSPGSKAGPQPLTDILPLLAVRIPPETQTDHAAPCREANLQTAQSRQSGQAECDWEW